MRLRLTTLTLALAILLCGCRYGSTALSKGKEELTVAAAEEVVEYGGENDYAISDYAEYGGAIFKVKLIASLSDRYEGRYKGLEDSHLALLLTDWVGADELLGYISRENTDAAALMNLLGSGGSVEVILRLKLPVTGEPDGTVRIVSLVSDSWKDPEDGYSAIIGAVKDNNSELVRELMDAGASVYARDDNGDGIIFHALRNGNTTMAAVLRSDGASAACRNYYSTGMDLLTEFEQQDMSETIAAANLGGIDLGCSAESLLGYYVQTGNGAAVDFLLSATDFSAGDYSLSEYASRKMAARYNIEAADNVRANVLDIAVSGGEALISRALLAGGVAPSSLLLAKIAQSMDFPQKTIEMLGEYKFFGVLDEVAADYAVFRATYDRSEQLTAEYNSTLAEFERLENQGKTFDSVYIISRDVYPAARELKAAAETLAEPSTTEIAAVRDLAVEYAAAVFRAANSLNNVNGNIVKSGRNYFFYLHERNQAKADAKLDELEKTIRYYDGILAYLNK